MYKKSLVILAGLFLLAGCGGGSSTGGTSGYNGSTSLATITTANARALSADAYSGRQSSGPVAVGMATTDTSGKSTLLLETGSILEDCISTNIGGFALSTRNSAAAPITTQIIGNGFSGSYTFTSNYDQTSHISTGTVVFSNYKKSSSTSATLSGTVSFSSSMTGKYGVSSDAGVLAPLNVSMNNLICTNLTDSYSISGSMVFNNEVISENVTMSVVLTNSSTGRTYWFKDFTLTLTGSSLTVSGTYFDPVLGYVVLSTITPLTVTTIDATPTSGQLLFSGNGGTKVRLTFFSIGRNSGGGNPTVEADTDGNGNYVVIP